jgi:hypothetical protein
MGRAPSVNGRQIVAVQTASGFDPTNGPSEPPHGVESCLNRTLQLSPSQPQAKVKGMRWLWWVAVFSLLATAIAWAAYVTEYYLFLARAFPVRRVEAHGWSALVASAQGYLVAFGPLALGRRGGLDVVGSSVD